VAVKFFLKFPLAVIHLEHKHCGAHLVRELYSCINRFHLRKVFSVLNISVTTDKCDYDTRLFFSHLDKIRLLRIRFKVQILANLLFNVFCSGSLCKSGWRDERLLRPLQDRAPRLDRDRSYPWTRHTLRIGKVIESYCVVWLQEWIFLLRKNHLIIRIVKPDTTSSECRSPFKGLI